MSEQNIELIILSFPPGKCMLETGFNENAGR